MKVTLDAMWMRKKEAPSSGDVKIFLAMSIMEQMFFFLILTEVKERVRQDALAAAV